MPFLLPAAAPAAAQTTCPADTVFVPGAQPQANAVQLPSFQGGCRHQTQTRSGGQAPRTDQRPADSTTTLGITR